MINLQLLGMLGLGNAVVLGLPTSFDLFAEIEFANEIKLATAFGYLSGWNLIQGSMEKSAAKVRLLTGLSFCQTEPQLLSNWLKMSLRDTRFEARLFVESNVIFHPKVLLIKSMKCTCVLIGSGNLSGGGFLNNIECSLFSAEPGLVEAADEWFERLFTDNLLTSPLRSKDMDQYRTKYNQARRKSREIEKLEHQIEDRIATRHQASLGKWEQAVAEASRFFKSRDFKDHYFEDRVKVGPEIRRAFNCPTFEFDREGLERFYKIQTLGHLIEIQKNRGANARSFRRVCAFSPTIPSRLNSD